MLFKSRQIAFMCSSQKKKTPTFCKLELKGTFSWWGQAYAKKKN